PFRVDSVATSLGWPRKRPGPSAQCTTGAAPARV
ncbi:hypothetical protein HaLaN_27211, partial [Haematococcus lacustris]